MEKIFNINLTETELNYIKETLSSLIEIQKAIPKKFQTKKSEILHSCYNKLSDLYGG